MNVQANQKIDTMERKIDTMESSLNQKLDVLQREIDQKFDNLQYSISRLTNQQNVHQVEENPEEECLIDTTVEEHCKQQNEAISPLPTEEGSGKEVVEEPQKPILKPLPTKLNPSTTAQTTNSPLPAAPSPDPVHILPTLAAHSTHETPTANAIPSALPMQNFMKLVAYVKTFATTSQTFAATHIAWHIGWLIPKPSWLRFGAPKPQQSHHLHQFQQPPKA